VTLGVLRLKADPELEHGEAQLQLLRDKLQSLPTEAPPGEVESLRLELFSLLEEQPKLHKAYMVACYTDLFDIVSSRLKYFIDWSDERNLTEDEERQKRRLEAELLKAKALLEMAFREAQEG